MGQSRAREGWAHWGSGDSGRRGRAWLREAKRLGLGMLGWESRRVKGLVGEVGEHDRERVSIWVSSKLVGLVLVLVLVDGRWGLGRELEKLHGELVGKVGGRVVERVREVTRRVILGGAEWGSRWETLPGRAGVRGLEGVGRVKQLKGRAWGIRQEVGHRVVVGAGVGLPVVVGGVQVVRVR